MADSTEPGRSSPTPQEPVSIAWLTSLGLDSCSYQWYYKSIGIKPEYEGHGAQVFIHGAKFHKDDPWTRQDIMLLLQSLGFKENA